MPTPKILDQTVTIADDIRREDNGKILIIGAYPEGIVAPVFPLVMPMALLFQFFVDGWGELRVDVEVRSQRSDKKLFGFTGVLTLREGLLDHQRYPQLLVSGVPLKFDEPGIYSINIKPQGEDWHVVRVFSVEHNPGLMPGIIARPPSSSSEPPPLS
jgi:hypothetical protein